MNRKKSWWILFIISLFVIIPFMAPYFLFNPDHSRIAIFSTTIQFPALIAHIFFAFIALIAGFLQFGKSIRENNHRIHKITGRIYFYSINISALFAIIVIFYVDNFSKAISFLVLTILWLFTTWKGIDSARKENFVEHRKWLIRSFGITLVAITGRIVVPILLLTYSILNGFHLPGGREGMIEDVLNVNIWVGLIVNFIIVEWGILNKKSKS